MNNDRFGASPPEIFPEDSPGIRTGEAERQKQESSKRQQCVRATELAKRTGLELRYAGLFEMASEPEEKNSGKAFDESGRRSFKGIPGDNRVSCHWKSGCMSAFVPLRTAVLYSRGGRTKTGKGQEDERV